MDMDVQLKSTLAIPFPICLSVVVQILVHIKPALSTTNYTHILFRAVFLFGPIVLVL